MTRSTIREHVFKALFRAEFYTAQELDEQVRLYLSDVPEMEEEDAVYIGRRVAQISQILQEIDEQINEVSEGWPVNRLGKAELTILRLAVYEMKYDEDIPVNVAINEAVELAKKYGAENAPSFINGVLAKLV